MREVRLTTIDNPYDPFEQFNEWYRYDESKGYCTCGLVDRITKTSPNFGGSVIAADTEAAIDEIVELFPDGFYKKIVKSDSEENKNKETES